MRNKEEIEQALTVYVKDNTYKNTESLSASTMLFVEGIFDSMGFVMLLDHLEEVYQVVPADDELLEENFESINAIIDFIQRKSVSVS